MVRRSLPWLLAFALFGAAAVTLQFGFPGTRTLVDAPDASAGAVAPALPETLPLPSLRVGASVTEVSALLGPTMPPHEVSNVPDAAAATWEWSEPAGRYALAGFRDGALVSGSVRRPFGTGLPAVEARVLPVLRAGASRAGIERVAGAGLAIERVTLDGGGDAVTDAWAIRDRGIGTGHVLRVTYRDGRAIAVDHPWAAR